MTTSSQPWTWLWTSWKGNYGAIRKKSKTAGGPHPRGRYWGQASRKNPNKSEGSAFEPSVCHRLARVERSEGMRMTDFVAREAIIPELTATTKEAVVREMIGSLGGAGYFKAGETEDIVKAVLKR